MATDKRFVNQVSSPAFLVGSRQRGHVTSKVRAGGDGTQDKVIDNLTTYNQKNETREKLSFRFNLYVSTRKILKSLIVFTIIS